MRTSWLNGAAIVCALLGVAGCSATPNSGDFAEETAAGSQQQALSGSWASFTNTPPGGLGTCLLLTTGDVMCHQSSTNVWHRLRPDALGSYRNGTWDSPPIPPMPNGNGTGCSNCTYAPLYFASAVLKDGRAIVIGGEYLSNVNTETNVGFIYDPVANSWSSQLTEPTGSVGDAMGLVLQDGTFALFPIFDSNVEVLNPATGVFTALNPSGKLDRNSEENPAPLYDGTVLTVDSGIASSFERYNPSSNTWGNSGSMPVNLADTGAGTGFSTEIGPCALRPDNQLACFSGNPLGQNAIYNPATNSWTHSASMDFPAAPGGGHFAMADGPAAALPNGNILVLGSPVTTTSAYNSPSHFYELGFSDNTLTAVADTPNVSTIPSYVGRMIVLPTGEVLFDGSDTMLYTANGGPQDAWRPVVTSVPSSLSPGDTFTISGRQFNGFTEGASYGDDAQSATNYPLVRITNQATGHVFYARTFNHSRMGVVPVGSTTVVSTSFQVPANVETGAATLQVVTNGIASAGVAVTISSSSLVALSRSGWVASASNTSGGDVPANALDGNTASRWSDGIPQSDGATHTFTIDMLSAQSFSQIKLDSNGDYARNYQVFVSNDGSNWGSAVASGSSSTASTVITFSSVTARYLQVRQSSAAGVGSWWSIYELNVYGSGSSGGGSALPRSGWVLSASATAGGDSLAGAIDGNTATRWSSGVPQSNAATQTLTIDMLSAQAFDKLTLLSNGDYARNYQVYASNSTSSWGSSIASGTGTTGTTTISFAAQNARYIQIRQSSAAGVGSWWSVYELNVYSPAAAPTALPRAGWTATGSSTTESPLNALDGVASTRWSSGAAQANGQYYQLDMQSAKAFRQITLDSSGSAGDYPRGYQVFVSNDGVSWGSAIASGTPTTALVTIAFSPQSARFIKVVQTGSAASNWWSIHELNVYN